MGEIMKQFPDFENLKLEILDERFYQSPTDPEKYYPGATTILQVWPKPELIRWYKEVGHNAELIAKIAMQKGSNVHNGIQQFLLGNPVVYQTEEFQYELDEWEGITRFMQFYWRYKPKTIAVERVLVSDKYRFGGTVDYVCEINGEIWLIDHKFSNNLYAEYDYQLASYYVLLSEAWEKVDHVGILHLKAKTRTEKEFQGKGWQLKEIPKEKLKHGFSMFQTAQKIWEELNPNYKPKNKIMPMMYDIKTEPDKELLYGN